MDMTNGPLLKKLILFTVPLICSSLLQLLFNTADFVVVGRFAGDNSLAAVGSNTPVVGLLTNIFVGLSVGANVLTGRYFGSKQDGELSRTVHTSMLLSLISGVALAVVGISGARLILELMLTPADVLPLAVLYLRIYFIGMPAMMIYNFGAAVLRAVGDTRRPFLFLLIAGAINVVLNLLFVIVFKMDVAGVAIATVISQCISAAFIVRCLMKEKSAVKLTLKKLGIDTAKLKEIMKIGIPAGFQGMIFSISNVIIQSSVNSFDSEVIMAGNAAALNIEQYVYFIMNGFHQAAITFNSQNYGAGKIKRVYRASLLSVICVFVAGAAAGLLAYLHGPWLLRIFSENPEVIAAGMERMGVICVTYFTCGIMDVLVGALRGIGYSVLPMTVALVGVCGVRLTFIFTVFSMEQYHTTHILYLAYPFSWIATASVLAVCFFWAAHRVKLKMEAENRLPESYVQSEASDSEDESVSENVNDK